MKASTTDIKLSQLAACVAPEDLNAGDFVATLNVVCEYPSFFWNCDGSGVPVNEPVKIRFQASDSGTPLKIEAICLPFVFVKTSDGNSRTLDVRKVQLVRLDSAYAKTVWKRSK